MSVCVTAADSGETNNSADAVAISTTEEEIPLDTDLSEYIDVEGRTADYLTVAGGDADSMTDGLRASELALEATAAVARWVLLSLSVCLSVCLQCFDAVGWAAGRASGL